jgi:hypothetical protein
MHQLLENQTPVGPCWQRCASAMLRAEGVGVAVLPQPQGWQGCHPRMQVALVETAQVQVAG